MGTEIRPFGESDIPTCGEIAFRAFRGIAERHGFPPDFPSPEAAAGLLGALRGAPLMDGFVAERGGRTVGSVFVSRRSTVGGISMLTVDPEHQDGRVGRALLEHGMTQLEAGGCARVQLVQAAYHSRSLALYARLGFAGVAALSNLQGAVPRVAVPGVAVRPAGDGDIAACNALVRRTLGFDRGGELDAAVAAGTARVAERDGRIVGCASAIGFVGHAVAEDNDVLVALIGSADEFAGPGILVPTANGELLRWGLAQGLRLVQQMTLMETGVHQPPQGPYLPSVLC